MLVAKRFFPVIYKNPINRADSPEFEDFVLNVETLYEKLSSENPSTMV